MRNQKNITIRMPSDVYERLEESIRYTEESKSAYIVRVLQERFNENEYEPLNHNAKTIFSNRILMKFLTFTMSYCVLSASKLSDREQAVVEDQANKLRKVIREMI